MKKLISAAVVLCCSCATITGGSRANVSFRTLPEGATALVGTVQCTTPCIMSVSRKAKQIEIKKNGYETLNMELDKGFRGVPVILGNILWLPVGLAVDFIAGGAYSVDPVSVSLEQQKQKAQ